MATGTLLRIDNTDRVYGTLSHGAKRRDLGRDLTDAMPMLVPEPPGQTRVPAECAMALGGHRKQGRWSDQNIILRLTKN